ncbi:MAG: FtsQ-type POTRA domain-containing protein, partial [Candidatus Acidiferrales bacterium]
MDADAYHQEVLSEEEPKYLRRQKPVEIRRRKFGKKAWKTYLRVSVMIVASVAAAGALYAMGNFLLTSPEMSLTHPDQIALTGNHFVSRPSVLEVFAADRGRSVLRVPLDARRKQLESLPWVERATVRRALPNHLQVEIVERVPIAFLRDDSDLSLIDV